MATGTFSSHPRPGPLDRVQVHVSGSKKAATAVAPIADHPGWTAVAKFTIHNGELSLRRVEVLSEQAAASSNKQVAFMIPEPRDEPEGQIGHQALRKVPLSDIHAAVYETARSASAIVELHKERRRPGRPGQPPLYWATWAARYVESCASSEQPVKDLADTHGLRPQEVRDIIHRCRPDYLTSLGRGRSGGELTPKARRYLAASAEGGLDGPHPET